MEAAPKKKRKKIVGKLEQKLDLDPNIPGNSPCDRPSFGPVQDARLHIAGPSQGLIAQHSEIFAKLDCFVFFFFWDTWWTMLSR